MREWKKKNAECYRAVWISTFGIPCFVRNLKFVESLLADIGVVSNGETLEEITKRLDVTKLLIFTSEVDLINNQIQACADREWFNIIIKEEAQMSAMKMVLRQSVLVRRREKEEARMMSFFLEVG